MVESDGSLENLSKSENEDRSTTRSLPEILESADDAFAAWSKLNTIICVFLWSFIFISVIIKGFLTFRRIKRDRYIYNYTNEGILKYIARNDYYNFLNLTLLDCLISNFVLSSLTLANFLIFFLLYLT